MSTRIIYFSHATPSEGAPHPFMAAYWLRWRGHDVHLVCPGDGAAATIETPLGEIHATTCGGGNLRYLLAAMRQFRSRARAGAPATVYYVHGHVAAPAAYLGSLMGFASRTIYHTQDYLEPGRHPGWEYFERRVARRARFVISNEPGRARCLASNYHLPRAPLVVRTALPGAWPVPERSLELRASLLERLECKDSARSILVAAGGGFDPVRCGPELVAAFKRLPAHYGLLFTGARPGSAQHVATERALHAAGVRPRVLVLDRLPYPELLSHYAAADIGLLLYPNDGIGNYFQCPGRLTEYLRCGLPFISSAAPGLETIAWKFRAGLVCSPLKPTTIAQAIESLGERPLAVRKEERMRLSALARTELAYETEAHRIEEAVAAAAQSPA